MPRKRSQQGVYAADFETTVNTDRTRVWLWGIADIDGGEVEWGSEIESFIGKLSQIGSTVYFHNLKFDGPFIVDWLLNNGFKHTKSQKLMAGEFNTLISGAGEWYTFRVKWLSGAITEFRNSLRKLPMSITDMAEAFELDVTKGEIDYALDRPEGWEPTNEEIDYLERDVLILAKALKIVIDEGATRLTVGSDSLKSYRDMITPKMFSRLFPVLPYDIDVDIRKAYRGGFTYVSERFKGKLIGEGSVYDVNSLYPYVMYTNRLPFGEPRLINDEIPDYRSKDSLYVLRITITARLKDGHIPCIQIKNTGRFGDSEYLSEIPEPIEISCTNIDLALWEDHYDLTIHEFSHAWEFKSAKGLFTQFIDKWMKVKMTSTGGRRALAKLHLNSLYGKFATNPDVSSKIPTLKEDGIVHLEMDEPERRDPIYTAMGVFITSYARSYTIRAAQAHYDEFVYADTDSLHLLTLDKPSDLPVHKSTLGMWKHEYDFGAAVFSRAKCYTELKTPNSDLDQDKYEYETHIAGLPSKLAEKVRFYHHLAGATFTGKLMPRRVPGGIVLIETTFQLNR